ncbi:response regulator transcription factor [Allokutzneria sp. NRRL B-24872]|uniref:response regulator n=1 Tax=Allokutzneria sp. NRRL B-24872 TaxID=1137961 RepID=UPI000A37E94A|nr:response regulator transcription factor [Allokutzneria sp. NRRL B-24872]
MIRVVVVDDHPVVRDGLRGMLAGQADFEVVGEAENGSVALDVVAREVPDVVLMDLRMPVLDGVSAIARLQSTHPSVQVLVLTTYDADTEIVRAVEAGATGCLLKDAPREVLFRAVRAAARGESVLAPELTAKLFGRLRTPKQESLTEREIEVLALVARGHTNRAIGRELSISEATVKTHLVHAFTKLGVDDRTAAVTVALERGLLSLNKPRR